MKKILICIVAAMIATISMAQERRGEQRQRREFNPEEMAMRQTNSLNEVLQLDSIQYQAIMLMNYADELVFHTWCTMPVRYFIRPLSIIL